MTYFMNKLNIKDNTLKFIHHTIIKNVKFSRIFSIQIKFIIY